MKPIQTISFRRSGTHFLIETLKKNFSCEISSRVIHPGFDLHTAVVMRLDYNVIYIYRNPKDVMKSLYNFFKYSDWKFWSGFDVRIADSFTGFINGESKAIDVFCPHFHLVLTDPINAWVEHTNWMLPLNKFDVRGSVFSIKYENLKDNGAHEIKRISEHFDTPINNGCFSPFTTRVSMNPKADIIEWTDKDLELLDNKAGKRMKDLGYKE